MEEKSKTYSSAFSEELAKHGLVINESGNIVPTPVVGTNEIPTIETSADLTVTEPAKGRKRWQIPVIVAAGLVSVGLIAIVALGTRLQPTAIVPPTATVSVSAKDFPPIPTPTRGPRVVILETPVPIEQQEELDRSAGPIPEAIRQFYTKQLDAQPWAHGASEGPTMSSGWKKELEWKGINPSLMFPGKIQFKELIPTSQLDENSWGWPSGTKVTMLNLFRFQLFPTSLPNGKTVEGGVFGVEDIEGPRVEIRPPDALRGEVAFSAFREEDFIYPSFCVNYDPNCPSYYRYDVDILTVNGPVKGTDQYARGSLRLTGFETIKHPSGAKKYNATFTVGEEGLILSKKEPGADTTPLPTPKSLPIAPSADKPSPR